MAESTQFQAFLAAAENYIKALEEPAYPASGDNCIYCSKLELIYENGKIKRIDSKTVAGRKPFPTGKLKESINLLAGIMIISWRSGHLFLSETRK